MISASEFVDRYTEWLEIIDATLRPEYYPAIRRMYITDPHDLVTPESRFSSQASAIGFLFCMIITTHKQLKAESSYAGV